MTAYFVFDGDDLVCERVYFDHLTLLRQLGLAHDSRSLAGRVTTLVSAQWMVTALASGCSVR